MSRQMACWAYRERPDPRPCPEGLPGPQRPTEPAVGKEGEPRSELRAKPGAQRCCCLGDKSGASANQLTTKCPRNDKPRATGREWKGLLERTGRLQLLARAS